MTDRHFQYALPEEMKLGDFQSRLPEDIPFNEESQRVLDRIYYDSFDWRLYNQGWVLEEVSVEGTSLLNWRSLKGEYYASLRDYPPLGFASDLPVGALREALEPVLEMRTLLPRAKVCSQQQTLRVLNEDEKTVLRMVLEENRLPEAHAAVGTLDRIWLLPVKGYDKPKQAMVSLFQQELGLTIAEDLMLTVLAALQERPGEYSSKLTLQLDPVGETGVATREILKTLLQTLECNEAGTLKDLDSEFLHDFRVAVRRTRSALSQIKDVLPVEALEHFRQEFAWLGQLTGPTRDMDVYLLKFEDYRDSLSDSVGGDLGPLHQFLQAEQKKEQKVLAKALKSDRYRQLVDQWRDFLDAPQSWETSLPNVTRPTQVVAGERIWKVYRRVLKEGTAIKLDTPAEALHDLRKTCKKLRYLMEFFQSLYPPAEIKTLIKALKVLQENLGDFQDLEVQVSNLKHFGRQMLEQGETPAEAIMAMGILVNGLEQRQHQAREEFADRFAEFERSENRKLFKELFASVPAQEVSS